MGRQMSDLEAERDGFARQCEHLSVLHIDAVTERDELREGLREALDRLPAPPLGMRCWFGCGAVMMENPWDDPTDPERHAEGCRYVALRELAGVDG